MPKTILHITDLLQVGGTEVLLANTLPELTEYNHVVVYLRGENHLQHLFENYNVHGLGHTDKSTIIRSVKRLRKLLKQYKPDIIHSHLQWSSFIARLAKPKGVRLISSIHSVLSKDAFEKNRLSLWMEKLTANRQDDVIGVSRFVIDDYLQFVPFKGRSHVLYNFIPDHFFSASDEKINLPEKKMPVRCIAIGNLKEVKNYSYTLTAFGLLPTGQFSLDIAGEGPLREKLEQKIVSDKLPIRLLGNQNDISALLNDYSVFIQASTYEGFGIAIAEAVGKGLIPVLSDIPVHREITTGKAIYFGLNNPQNLADKLTDLTLKPIDEENMLKVQEHIKKISGAAQYFKHLRDIYNS